MVTASRDFARYAARTDDRLYVLQQRKLGAADAYDRPATLAAMRACKRYGSLAIYDTGYISSLGFGQFSDARHHRVPAADLSLAETENRARQRKSTEPITG